MIMFVIMTLIGGYLLATFLILIIYIAFISLGLPDAVLGAAWPIMQGELNAPLEAAGLLFGMISVGTVISSLFSGTLLKKYGTGRVTVVSVMLTAIGLLGFNYAESIYWLLFFTLPLGLGAGAVDAGLNDYVAINYKAYHMNWLHAFWGVGATIGPLVLSQIISRGYSWRNSYLIIAAFQFVLVLILLITLPLWKKVAGEGPVTQNAPEGLNQEQGSTAKKPNIFSIPGVKWALLTFVFYTGIEQTVNLWGSTFLVDSKGIDPATAAEWLSFYFLGITIGRVLSGFISFKLSNKQMLRLGQAIVLMGTLVLLLPLPNIFMLIGLILIGLGCAPVYPSMLHETPTRFGTENSQYVMGLQLAAGNTGALLLPPLFGLVASRFSVNVLPIFLVIYAIILLSSTERLNLLASTTQKLAHRAPSLTKL